MEYTLDSYNGLEVFLLSVMALTAIGALLAATARDAVIALWGMIFAVLVGSFMAGLADKHVQNIVKEQFEDYYNVRVIEGTVPIYSTEGDTIEIYFNETGEFSVCSVSLQDWTYGGFCDNGETL